MAVHFFYEETKPRDVPVSGDPVTINRYYYDDIPAEILIRLFQSDGMDCRGPSFPW